MAEVSLTGLKSRRWQADFFFWRLQGRTCFLPFRASVRRLHSLGRKSPASFCKATSRHLPPPRILPPRLGGPLLLPWIHPDNLGLPPPGPLSHSRNVPLAMSTRSWAGLSVLLLAVGEGRDSVDTDECPKSVSSSKSF